MHLGRRPQLPILPWALGNFENPPKDLEVRSMTITRRPILSWLIACSLVVSQLGGILLDDRASAAGQGGDRGSNGFRQFRADKIDKIAGNLRDSVRSARKRNREETVPVIIRLNGNMSGSLRQFLRGNGVRVKKQFVSFNTLAVDLPSSAVD